MSARIGIVGARGYVGRELLTLIAAHPELELAFVSSRKLAGQRIAADDAALSYEALDADAVATREVDVCVLALPNGLARDYVAALERTRPQTIVIDLSGDHRFDDRWQYGLPELRREGLARATRISNPGCYATAMQLAIAPVRERLAAAPVCFGVSGYSGAGTTPSPRNDPERLRDNLVPYALTGHLHEREVTRQLGTTVHFTPHVAQFFRGISMTVVLRSHGGMDAAAWHDRYAEFYAGERLVAISDAIPQVRDAVGCHGATVGGFATDEHHTLVVVATLDNLLKGAATQAMQNINIACGYDELEGITHD